MDPVTAVAYSPYGLLFRPTPVARPFWIEFNEALRDE